MDHRHLADDLLNEYLDGAIGAEQRNSIEAELLVCSRCRRRLDELQGVFTVLHNWPEIPLGRDLAPAVLAAVNRRSSSWLTGQIILVSQLAISVALLASVWSFLVQQTQSIAFEERISRVLNGLNESLALFSSQWATWTASWAMLIQRGSALARTLPPIELPALTLWITIGAIGLAWLLGNGLLLRGNGSK